MVQLDNINEDNVNAGAEPEPQAVDPINTNHLRSGDMDNAEDDLSDIEDDFPATDDGAMAEDSRRRVTVSFPEAQLDLDDEDVKLHHNLKNAANANDDNSLHSNMSFLAVENEKVRLLLFLFNIF